MSISQDVQVKEYSPEAPLAGSSNGTRLENIRKQRADSLHLQPLGQETIHTIFPSPALIIVSKYEPSSPVFDPGNKIASPKPSTWDSE